MPDVYIGRTIMFGPVCQVEAPVASRTMLTGKICYLRLPCETLEGYC